MYPYVYLLKNFKLQLKFEFKLSHAFPALGWIEVWTKMLENKISGGIKTIFKYLTNQSPTT